MKVTLKRLDKSLRFQGLSEDGFKVDFDSSADGYQAEAARPMEVVLMSAASCASIDVVLILKKMKQDLKDIQVEAQAKRPEDGDVKPFVDIHLHFKLFGELDQAKAQRAVSLSVEKYCSVLEMLKSTAKVGHSLEIIRS